MVQENDKIQFESRREIENIMVVLNDYIKRHKKDDDATLHAAQSMIDRLEVMHMTW